MSTNLGDQLPGAIQSLLSGENLLDKAGLGFLLVSQSADEYPHACILSAGEVLASDESTLRLALAAESSTSRNLRIRPAATLCLAADGAAYYIKCKAEPLSSPPEGLAFFIARIHAVLEDREPSAVVTSGFAFVDQRDRTEVQGQQAELIDALWRARA